MTTTIETLMKELDAKRNDQETPIQSVRMARASWEGIKPAIFHYQYTSTTDTGTSNTLLGVRVEFDESLPIGNFDYRYAYPIDSVYVGADRLY